MKIRDSEPKDKEVKVENERRRIVRVDRNAFLNTLFSFDEIVDQQIKCRVIQPSSQVVAIFSDSLFSREEKFEDKTFGFVVSF